ncbi:Techylectin-5A [Araneus ventricosus]|uniref:Techylectin-5A n=1 Tax=Araneus ventricosus TaxID=182803 RepID=A0A4Y2DGU3_ARAVE|nr:Techylectin-5A [Araneus ventricosus]
MASSNNYGRGKIYSSGSGHYMPLQIKKKPWHKFLFCLVFCLTASFSISTSELDAYVSSSSDRNSAISKLSTQNTACNVPYPKPADCEEVRRNGYNESGVYTVYPRNRLGLCSLTVFCDMDTMGGGWTVSYSKKRQSGKSDQFGHSDKEFWLGNDNIFILTHQDSYSALFEMENIQQQYVYALYDKFWIDDESHNYKLNIGGYSGNAGDSMHYHNGNFFSTRDHDNDRARDYHCAGDMSSGWWFDYCLSSNLNGIRFQGSYDSDFKGGIQWHSSVGSFRSLVATEIKIRPRNFCKSSEDVCSGAIPQKEFTIKTDFKTPLEESAQKESCITTKDLINTTVICIVSWYILKMLFKKILWLILTRTPVTEMVVRRF